MTKVVRSNSKLVFNLMKESESVVADQEDDLFKMGKKLDEKIKQAFQKDRMIHMTKPEFRKPAYENKALKECFENLQQQQQQQHDQQ